VIRRNPCRIKGAAVENPGERPVLSLGEVQLLSAAIDPRYRAFVLLAVFGSLRWGELVGLRHSDFDLEAGLVRIERAISEIGAKQIIKKPKTAAGVHTVALPWWLVPELRRADRDRAIAEAIDLMLTGYDECPETLVGASASESGGDGHGDGECTPAVF
jgi:integrase